MTSGEAARSAFRQVESLFRSGSTHGLADGQLLARFADRRAARDEAEAAFASLVDRHGAMVLRACRRVLGDEHEAEEAAQATFLVLARRAGSIGRVESVGGWLHGVAVRVASKARVASARRRAREARGGRVAAERIAERGSIPNDPGRWAELHEELGRLPEKFRAPLVLCYLEGLTQEQAAEQLRWPLGTVQSRLARGKDRLRSRLVVRGVAPASALAGLVAVPAEAAPPAWSGATARAAVRFINQGSEAVRAGAWPAAAGLASEVLRDMMFTHLRSTLAATIAAATIAGAAALARPGQVDPPKPASRVEKVEPAPEVVKTTPPAPPRLTPPIGEPNRTVTGIVRDDQGRPLAKAWVGSDPRPMQDTWDNPRPEDIRERAEPFRDASGAIIPPGALGKYFEHRDSKGAWHPVSPDDINPFEPSGTGGDGRSLSQEEIAKNHSGYNIRVAKGGWWMAGMPGVQHPARTDAQGRFTTKFNLNGLGQAKLHFASGDYTLQATRLIKAADPDEPIDVTLRPTRLVRARVIEVPKDDPKGYLNWTAHAADPSGKIGEEWQRWMLPNVNNHDPDHVKRHLEVRLPFGRWKIEFRSQTVLKLVDIEVPPGEGPLDLPDLVLESLATVRMVGQPAAEIHATGLDGKAVRLADFRGKVVVLDFWATWCGPCLGAMPRLVELQKRFADKPLVILALHDNSVAGIEGYRKAIEPIKGRFWGGADLPFPVLIDDEPTGEPARPYAQKAGEKGSGRSGDTYEINTWPSTFVIAPDGKLVGKVEPDALEGVLEDQLGVPRSKPRVAAPTGRAVMPEGKRNLAVKGRVVGPDGRPVAGAKLLPQQAVVRAEDVSTGPDGGFAFEVERLFVDHFFVRVEAAGLASKMFRLDDSGDVREPLRLGVGATVSGRLVRDGRPVAGASMGLLQVERTMDKYLGQLEAKTDAEGRFRFAHAFTDQDFHAYMMTGNLKGGGVVVPRPLRVGGDGTAVDLGDVEVKPGRRISGRVAFSDGKAIPPKTRVLAGVEHAGGLIFGAVDAKGRFEVVGLPEAGVSLAVQFPDNRNWLPPGYRLSPTMKCVDPLNPYNIHGRLDRDLDDMLILYVPGEAPRMSLDPGLLKDFEEAKAGPLAGAPPESAPAPK